MLQPLSDRVRYAPAATHSTIFVAVRGDESNWTAGRSLGCIVSATGCPIDAKDRAQADGMVPLTPTRHQGLLGVK